MSDKKIKNLVLTGASRGIGHATVKRFSSAGWRVITCSRQEVPENCPWSAGMHDHVQIDLSSMDDILEGARKIIEKLEGNPLHALVNNAGIKKDNLLMRMEKSDFDSVINTNLSSVFNLTKALIKTFLKQRNGSIINISSVVGVKGNAGQSNYSASKAGIIGFSKSIALELGSRNIRSNVIAPGFIETDMTLQLDEDVRAKMLEKIPLARLGQPKDVASVVKFLASSSGEYITGETIHVNGGLYMG